LKKEAITVEENKKVILTGLIVVLIVAAGIVVYFLFFQKGKGEPTAQEMTSQKPAQALQEESIQDEQELGEFAQLELDKSDGIVRDLSRELSVHPKLARWLMSGDLVRRFVAAIDNVANGMSPRPQLDFFSPKGEFQTVKRGKDYILDPETFRRYDDIADVFLSLDTEESVKLYRRLKPLFQRAYKDLGYPEEDFDKTLFRAIVELLKVPIIEWDIKLNKDVVTYTLADPKLEGMSDAQKHLIRMGYENVHIIQEKLRELAQEMGFSDDRLPRPQDYIPEY